LTSETMTLAGQYLIICALTSLRRGDGRDDGGPHGAQTDAGIRATLARRRPSLAPL